MSRLGMLYALSNKEIAQLKEKADEEKFSYLLESLAPTYANTERAYELYSAWEGLHYVFGDGEWIESATLPYNIVFGGDTTILDDGDYVILQKSHDSLKAIVAYLESIDLKQLIWTNIPKIPEDDIDMPLDEDFMYFVWNWSKELKDFYRFAEKEGYDVIFSVDI